MTEQIKERGNEKCDIALPKTRIKQIGKTVYLVTSSYSGDKKINELIKKVIEREAKLTD